MVLVFFLLILLSVLAYLIYTSYFHSGAVYFPTKDKVVTQMLDLASVGKGDVVLDLGSGDGRILIAAAKRGARAIGYEIDPLLVVSSKRKIKNAKLSHLAKVHFKSLWNADFDRVTVITLYLFPKYMGRLKKLLDKKLDHSVLLISNDYQFPGEKHIKKKGEMYLYQFDPVKK